MEKLCGSIGASFALLYLVFATLFELSPEGTEIRPKVLGIVSLACLALGLAVWRDVVRLLSSFPVRRVLGGFLFLLAWTLVILGTIRNYSGANWYADWLGHFQKSLFFLHHFPRDTPILLGYQLSERPPAMNEMAAFFLGQTGDRFEIFQVIFAFLNLLMFLSCCLVMPALAKPRRTAVLLLVALFALNPVVMENVTYTWTKAFTGFYVIVGLWFYLAAWRKNDSLRMIAAFVALTMAFLVHYSAGPYLLFVGLHYLLRVVWKRPHPMRELATVAVVCGALLATWFGWSIAVYGTRATFLSNSSVTASQRYAGSPLMKVAGNVGDSIVPAVLRQPLLHGVFDEQGLAGAIRDEAFVFYQMNAIFGMGLVGGPIILWLLYRAFFRRRLGSSSERGFWLAMIAFCVVVGIASVGSREPLGVAHIALQPLEVLGLSLLAAAFPLRRALLWLVVAGCVIDFSLGIFLQARVESLENTPQRTVFAGLSLEGGKQSSGAVTPDSLSGIAWANWYLKHQYALNSDGLAQLYEERPADFAVGRAQMERALAEDAVYWHGWYARNGGAVEFLGDQIAGKSLWGTTVLPSVLILFMFWLVRAMLQYGARNSAARP